MRLATQPLHLLIILCLLPRAIVAQAHPAYKDNPKFKTAVSDGKLLADNQDYEDAIASYERVLELSPRERTIVQLIAEGHSNKEMSGILNLSIKTIETHRAAAMRKLEITSTAALVRYAIRNKIIEA